MNDNQPPTRPGDPTVSPPSTEPLETRSPETIASPSTPCADAAPSHPPGYHLGEELGRGAMGVVYRARPVALKRDVALKMILAGAHAGEAERRRFLAEAEAIASIQHPGIVQVFDFGTHAGLPYFALEFCPGGTLAKKLAGHRLPPRTAANLVALLADAVQAAHDKGVIHRDLK